MSRLLCGQTTTTTTTTTTTSTTTAAAAAASSSINSNDNLTSVLYRNEPLALRNGNLHCTMIITRFTKFTFIQEASN